MSEVYWMRRRYGTCIAAVCLACTAACARSRFDPDKVICQPMPSLISRPWTVSRGGELSGLVRNPNGRPVAQAKVRLTAVEGPDSGRVFTGTAGTDGAFLLAGLRPARYRVFVDAPDATVAPRNPHLVAIDTVLRLGEGDPGRAVLTLGLDTLCFRPTDVVQ